MMRRTAESERCQGGIKMDKASFVARECPGGSVEVFDCEDLDSVEGLEVVAIRLEDFRNEYVGNQDVDPSNKLEEVMFIHER